MSTPEELSPLLSQFFSDNWAVAGDVAGGATTYTFVSPSTVVRDATLEEMFFTWDSDGSLRTALKIVGRPQRRQPNARYRRRRLRGR